MPNSSSEVVGVLTTEPKPGGGSGDPLAGFHVSVRSTDSLFSFNGLELASGVTDATGRFDLSYFPDPSPLIGPRSYAIVARDLVGRVLAFAPTMGSAPPYQVTDTGTASFTDTPGTPKNLGTMVIRRADAMGMDVTLGTGTATMKSSGNAVTFLTDHDAFTHAANLFRSATQEILVSQLEFKPPKTWNADPAQETPVIVFDFADPNNASSPDLDHPRKIGPGDGRPERLLLDAVARGVDARIALHQYFAPSFINVGAGVYLTVTGHEGTPLTALDLKLNDVAQATGYFNAAPAPRVKVRGFRQPALTSGVLHAKNVLVDRAHFLSIGSPFKQSYNDSHDHRIDSWMRGDFDEPTRHDTGFAASGPITNDALATLKMIWNAAAPDDVVPDTMQPPSGTGPAAIPLNVTPDGTCTVQIVRTISANRIPGMPRGEKGILEGYLRAFANAKQFIYLENQYFTNDAIGDALAAALVANPALKVIALFNIEPDTPTYPQKQQRMITRIRKAIGQTPDGPQRFCVFSRWSYDLNEGLPRMMPVYIHAKAAVVDNTWAAIGSGNLDGFSLDGSLPSDILNSGIFDGTEARAIEVDGLFSDTAPGPVVDVLRRKLWAEHLGYMDDKGTPDITAADLQLGSKYAGDWTTLWISRATETKQHLIDNPLVPLGKLATVLPWTPDKTTHHHPRDHLRKLGIDTTLLLPLEGCRTFDFKTGVFNPDSKVKVDTSK
jgi:phosphatidylserine/phosphatidylglycerophosphate/cardiolipin synthase-like enzyme